MKTITILIPETAVVQGIVDPQYLFSAVNQFLVSAGGQPAFKIQLAAIKKSVDLNNGMLTMHADVLLKDVKHTDVVIVPPVSGDMQTAIDKNKDLLPWIIKQHGKGAEVISLCLGAFLLASTGLLNGKSCSTHWVLANQFRNMFPDVKLVDDKIVTESNGIYTSGGATSYWNLLLRLVEKYTDRQTAILASKYFALEFDRNSQSQFMMFKGQKDHEDDAIRKAQEYIEQNYSEKITVDDLAEKFAIGRRSLERRFKKVTGNTIVEYMQRVKMEAAKKNFELSRKNVNEVMYEVGYSDTKAFRDVFKKVTGMSPLDYRTKYNKRTMVLAS
jgi:transcriptional regulator GlxA family with amidase domain